MTEIEQSIKRKIEAVGTPLKDWDIQINYGIKTGFNDAFIISTEKRNEILTNCKSEEERRRTEELIRPILRGRDIKRYGYDWAGLWLIATFPSRHYDIEDYPAVKEHLLSFGMHRLEQTGKSYNIDGTTMKARKKTNNKWFETQDSISYWDYLCQPKIIWGEISDRSKFTIDYNGVFVPEATTFMLSGNQLLVLLSFLNCSVSEYLFSKIGTTTGVGTVRWKKFKIEELLIPNSLPTLKVDYIRNICEQIVKFKESAKDTYDLENELNNYIYDIYRLDDEEIAFIESYL